MIPTPVGNAPPVTFPTLLIPVAATTERNVRRIVFPPSVRICTKKGRLGYCSWSTRPNEVTLLSNLRSRLGLLQKIEHRHDYRQL